MRKILSIFSVIIILTSCSKNASDPALPAKVSLSSPAQNETCTTGNIISSTQNSVSFNWNSSANTDSYEINVKNLLTGTVTTASTSGTQISMILARNTPYSWYIVSKSNLVSNTAQSDLWKFYNAGYGVVSYPPFPANLTSPAFSQNVTAVNGMVNLTWTGSDVDNDIVAYDVYFGTSQAPAIRKGSVTDLFLNNIPVTSGSTYYWKVITRDSQGNTSDSGIFQFNVN